MFVIQVFVGGVLLYPTYRVSSRVVLEQLRLAAPVGIFDLKEHFSTIALGLLPAYGYYWRQPLSDETTNIRKFLTTIIATFVISTRCNQGTLFAQHQLITSEL